MNEQASVPPDSAWAKFNPGARGVMEEPETDSKLHERQSDESDSESPKSAPKAISIADLVLPSTDDPSELIRRRFLCRRVGLLLVGPTGIGKSSLSMQMMISWALGKECLGFTPTGPLKSLVVQAENDEGDLAEFRDGVFAGMNLDAGERKQAGERVYIATEDCRAGNAFCTDVLEPLLEKHRPDVLWIDPALAYIDGEANSQSDVGNLLRRGLNPLIHKYNCAVVVVHHTPKPLRTADSKKSTEEDLAYAGAGSAEWANWSRATVTLSRVADGIFKITVRKRGNRLGWVGMDGKPSTARTIAHCRDVGRIWWQEVHLDVAPDTSSQNQKARATVADLLVHVPQSREIGKATLQQLAQGAGINEKVFRQLLEAAFEAGELFPWSKKRPHARAAVYVARFAQPVEAQEVEASKQVSKPRKAKRRKAA